MLSFRFAFLIVVRVLARSRTDIALGVLALRQQLGVIKRKRPRPRLDASDRLFRACCDNSGAAGPKLIIVDPDTLVGWHRAGSRLYWR